ncbi:MAG: zinc-ribbon domain-containing protein [Armatimonadetes bacterium]|nr:zinc-ribbon domain-containing protein [Armatimonadota bacterium]
MIECPDCGAQNADNSTFCIRCGTQFSAPRGLGPLESPRQVDPSRLVDEAAELYAANQLDDAAEACHAALDIDPELVSARALLGMIEEDRGNYAAALAEYEAVIRLAPERTAEREKADRMRALVRREAGPAIPEEENRLRRYMPALIAVGAALVVLLVGGLIISAGARDRADDTAALDEGQSGGFLLQETSPQVGQPAATGEGVESLKTGGGVIPTTPIGATIQDQTAQQKPNAYQQGQSNSGGGGRSRTASVEPIPLPPPTVDSKPQGTGPLTTPAPEPATTPTPSIPAPSAIGPPTASEPEPLPQESRGKVRIWVGDDSPAPVSGNRGGGQAPTQGQGYQGPSLSQRERWSVNSRTGATVTTRSGSAMDSDGSGGPRFAPKTQSSSGVGGTAGRLTARAGNGGNNGGASGLQYQPRARQGGGYTGSVMPTQRDETNGAHVQPRNYHGPSTSAATRQPAQTRSAPVATSAQVQRLAGVTPSQQGGSSAGNGASGSTASALRAQAQRAQASGNSQQARLLYKAAIEGYAREAAANPARAASSRSAIDSCQRSLDALDASQ